MSRRTPLDPASSLWDWIAADLAYYRAKEGISLAKLAEEMNCVRQTVSNLELGTPGYRLSESQAKTLDDRWELNRHFSLLLLYAKAGHDPNWFKEYVIYEAKASVIKTWELAWIPGLLQTPDYARASLLAGGMRDVEGPLEARMMRKEVLTRKDAPILWVLLWEGALETCIGGRDVMGKQLGSLLDAAEDPGVNLRVVPRASGSHLGLDGSFKLLTMRSGEDLAFVEAPGGGRLVSSPEEVRSYELRYDRIGQHALPETTSRDLVRAIMEEL